MVEGVLEEKERWRRGSTGVDGDAGIQAWEGVGFTPGEFPGDIAR
jgi:hypothetical protein